MRGLLLWILALFIFCSVLLQFLIPHLVLPPTTTTVTKRSFPVTTTLWMVFSTSCTDQQHWESYAFFYHAMKVRQPGHITRIVSGCHQQEAEQLLTFHNNSIQPMSPNFHIHLTPDYSRVRTERGRQHRSYKYMNKPFGLRHWMENVLGMGKITNGTHFESTGIRNVENDVVILMDPDMILLRPILHDFTRDDNVIWVQEKDHPVTKQVRHGSPMAQQDGYLTNEWMKLNYSFIFQDTNATMVPHHEGPLYYNTGPPYLATVRDMFRIAVLWTEYAPRVYEVHPVLFAEMYGYIYATVKLKLRHTLIQSLVVSTTKARNREGWTMVDALTDDQLCPQQNRSAKQLSTLPMALHYCQRYFAGPWFFGKYRLKKNFISCKARLMATPPYNIYQYNYWIAPPKANEPGGLKNSTTDRTLFRNPRQVKRESFMLCSLISAINEASRYFKQQNCLDPNWDNTYTIHDSPGTY